MKSFLKNILQRKLKHGTGPIGCALSDDKVQLTQLCNTHSGKLTATSASHTLSPSRTQNPDAWYQAAVDGLREAWSSQSFIGREVVTCMLTNQAIFRRLQLAPMPDSDLPSAVHWQIAKELSWTAEEFQSAYYDSGEVLAGSKRYREVFAIAAAMADLESLVGIFDKAGLTPIAIDTRPGLWLGV